MESTHPTILIADGYWNVHKNIDFAFELDYTTIFYRKFLLQAVTLNWISSTISTKYKATKKKDSSRQQADTMELNN